MNKQLGKLSRLKNRHVYSEGIILNGLEASMGDYSYEQLFTWLSYNTAMVIFFKKNGELRCMLSTRCIETMKLCYEDKVLAFKGHDKRCSIENGNIGVMDLLKGEPRSFNVERMLSIYDCGRITSWEQLSAVMENARLFSEEYAKGLKNNNQIDEQMQGMFNGGDTVD